MQKSMGREQRVKALKNRENHQTMQVKRIQSSSLPFSPPKSLLTSKKSSQKPSKKP
jgi:hypothetical protein